MRFLVVAMASLGSLGCGETVQCENLCQHTLACEVTFRPGDDVDGSKLASGERTDTEDCKLGCEENPAVTVDSAKCVDDVTAKDTNPATCQGPVLDCFGASVPTTS